jgi:hypothetical protein
MSAFCFDEDECHASVTIGAGDRELFKVCIMLNCGCNVATTIVPFMYPIANVLQSIAGERAVIGSSSVHDTVLSDVAGSNRMTSPLEFPISSCQLIYLI